MGFRRSRSQRAVVPSFQDVSGALYEQMWGPNIDPFAHMQSPYEQYLQNQAAYDQTRRIEQSTQTVANAVNHGAYHPAASRKSYVQRTYASISGIQVVVYSDRVEVSARGVEAVHACLELVPMYQTHGFTVSWDFNGRKTRARVIVRRTFY